MPQNNPKHRLSILLQPKPPMTTRLNWQVATNIFVRVGAPEVLSKFLQTFPRHKAQSDSRLKRFQSLQASLKAQIYRITLTCCVLLALTRHVSSTKNIIYTSETRARAKNPQFAYYSYLAGTYKSWKQGCTLRVAPSICAPCIPYWNHSS